MLHCEDVAELHASLRAAGATVSDPEAQAWATVIKVTDPDGQQVVVSQPKPGS